MPNCCSFCSVSIVFWGQLSSYMQYLFFPVGIEFLLNYNLRNYDIRILKLKGKLKII
jgi:hypothetical protein